MQSNTYIIYVTIVKASKKYTYLYDELWSVLFFLILSLIVGGSLLKGFNSYLLKDISQSKEKGNSYLGEL